jgi:hypothetical protein
MVVQKRRHEDYTSSGKVPYIQFMQLEFIHTLFVVGVTNRLRERVYPKSLMWKGKERGNPKCEGSGVALPHSSGAQVRMKRKWVSMIKSGSPFSSPIPLLL